MTEKRKRPDSVVQVHHRGERGIDGILHLIELAGHDGAIETMLAAMCDEIASIANVDIASVYVREGEHLVMRGNHGFPPAAIGTTLDVGEGITGLVAECMRPVSAAHAATESAYKHVPGINEEDFPVFVGVPLIGGGTAIGVLVLQRADDAFASGEVTLAMALGAPVTLAIERRRASAIRAARLTGTPEVPGVVLGRVAAVPTATALSATPEDVERALARLSSDLGRAAKHLANAPREVGAALDRLALALMDQRLRERLVAAAGTPSGLRTVAKEYAKAPYRTAAAIGARTKTPSFGVPIVDSPTGSEPARPSSEARSSSKMPPAGGEPARPSGETARSSSPPPAGSEPARSRTKTPSFGVPIGETARASSSDMSAIDRVAEIEELCAVLGTTTLRPGSIWIADHIGAVVAIVAVARGAGAIVTADDVTPVAREVARAARLPLVTNCDGLFGWARPGDLVAVDGTAGEVLVHPAPTDIERIRAARKSSTDDD